MRRDIEFLARDVTLRGWLYTPDGAVGRSPTVIATHGWGCVKEQSLDKLGEALAAAGIVALIYDHRNTGASDSPIPGYWDPWEQIHDYRYAISFAMTLPEVDPDRIGVWGTSFSGGHSIVVGAIDRRVKAVAVQVPMLAGLANSLRLMATMTHWNATQDMLEQERARWARGQEPARIPITAADESTPHAFPGKEIFEFFTSWGDKAPNWKNECTLMSLDLVLEYDPTAYLERLGTKPVLFILGEQDLTTPPDLAIDGYAKIKGPKELITFPGTHYNSYLEHMDSAAQSAATFFARNLRAN